MLRSAGSNIRDGRAATLTQLAFGPVCAGPVIAPVVCTCVPNYKKFSRVERVVISVRYYKKRAYWDFLKAQIGKPYDKLAIVAFAVKSTPSWMTAVCLVVRRASRVEVRKPSALIVAISPSSRCTTCRV